LEGKACSPTFLDSSPERRMAAARPALDEKPLALEVERNLSLRACSRTSPENIPAPFKILTNHNLVTAIKRTTRKRHLRRLQLRESPASLMPVSMAARNFEKQACRIEKGVCTLHAQIFHDDSSGSSPRRPVARNTVPGLKTPLPLDMSRIGRQ